MAPKVVIRLPHVTHIWRWKVKLGERFGQRCHVICRGKLNSALVEFEDGFKVVTSKYAVRRIEELR